MASLSQAELEKILRAHLENLGGHVELGMEVVGIEQDQNEVTVRIPAHQDGPHYEHVIRCDYLVAAD